MTGYLRTLFFMGIALATPACQSAANESIKKLTGFKVINLHGFGGKREDPYFLRAMRTFQQDAGISFELVNRNWDSVKIDVMDIKNIGPQWRQAKDNAAAESTIFQKDLDNLEAGKTPYYLTAYSLGTKIIIDALNGRTTPLKLCKGIYFMGAALPKDYSVKAAGLPKGIRIINYYSPKYDTVLDLSFRTSEGKVAGGQVGFDNTTIFTNYHCTCTHVYKGVGVHSDWSQMAEAIGYLILRNEGIVIPGETAANIYFRVGDGSDLWNNIIRFNNVTIKSLSQYLLIQQHKLDGHYRAVVMVSPQSKRYRVAWGHNLHAILREFSLFKK